MQGGVGSKCAAREAGDSPASSFACSRGIIIRAAFLGILGLTVSLPTIGDWCLLSPDGIQFLTVARTLYETGWFPSQPFGVSPGFPLLVAPLLASGDFPFIALRLLSGGCWAGTAVLTYLLHRRGLGERLAWAAGLVVAVSPVLLQQTTQLLSEGVFTLLVAAALVIAGGRRNRAPAQWPRVVAAGLLTASAILVRVMGLALVPFIAIDLLWYRPESGRRHLVRVAIFLLCALGPVFAWQVRQARLPALQGYADQWRGARTSEGTRATGLALHLERLRKYGPERLESLKEVLVPRDLGWRAYQPPWSAPTDWVFGGGLAAIGLVRYLRRREAADGYVLLSLLILALWPWSEGVRFVVPLIPVVAAYPLWLGLEWSGRKRAPRAPKPKWRRAVLAGGVAVLLTLQIGGLRVALSRLPQQRQKAEQRFAVMKTLADWHTANTPPGSSWLGVTPDGNESKVLLLGAAYLARREVRTIDLQDGQPPSVDATGAGCVFVFESIWNGGLAIEEGWGEADRVGSFVVLRREGK